MNRAVKNITMNLYWMANSILVICQELFEKDFDMFFRNKGNFNRPSGMLCTKPNVSSI